MKNDLKTRCKVKELLLPYLTIVQDATYQINISAEEWHLIFKTEECKKRGLIKGKE